MEQITIVLCLTRWVLMCIAEDAKGLTEFDGEPDRAVKFQRLLEEYLISEDEACADDFETDEGADEQIVVTTYGEDNCEIPDGLTDEAAFVQDAIGDFLAFGSLEPDSRHRYSVMSRGLVEPLSKVVEFFSRLSDRSDLESLVTALRNIEILSREHPNDDVMLSRWSSLRELCIDIVEQQILSVHVMLEFYMLAVEDCRQQQQEVLAQIKAAHPMFNGDRGCVCERVALLDELEPAVRDAFVQLVPALAPDSDSSATLVINGEPVTVSEVENFFGATYRRYREIAQ